MKYELKILISYYLSVQSMTASINYQVTRSGIGFDQNYNF